MREVYITLALIFASLITGSAQARKSPYSAPKLQSETVRCLAPCRNDGQPCLCPQPGMKK